MLQIKAVVPVGYRWREPIKKSDSVVLAFLWSEFKGFLTPFIIQKELFEITSSLRIFSQMGERFVIYSNKSGR